MTETIWYTSLALFFYVVLVLKNVIKNLWVSRGVSNKNQTRKTKFEKRMNKIGLTTNHTPKIHALIIEQKEGYDVEFFFFCETEIRNNDADDELIGFTFNRADPNVGKNKIRITSNRTNPYVTFGQLFFSPFPHLNYVDIFWLRDKYGLSIDILPDLEVSSKFKTIKDATQHAVNTLNSIDVFGSNKCGKGEIHYSLVKQKGQK